LNNQNILLEKNGLGNARLADFGIARAGFESEKNKTFTVTRRIVGTSSYMAPEYLMSGEVSPSIDVFSMGVVMLELMAWSLVESPTRSTTLLTLLGPCLTDHEDELLEVMRRQLNQPVDDVDGTLRKKREKASFFSFGSRGGASEVTEVSDTVSRIWPNSVLFEFAALADRCLHQYRRYRPTSTALARQISAIIDQADIDFPDARIAAGIDDDD
jgi:serine/threonine protein kinase